MNMYHVHDKLTPRKNKISISLQRILHQIIITSYLNKKTIDHFLNTIEILFYL